jgi:hypothetical protein
MVFRLRVRFRVHAREVNWKGRFPNFPAIASVGGFANLLRR